MFLSQHKYLAFLFSLTATTCQQWRWPNILLKGGILRWQRPKILLNNFGWRGSWRITMCVWPFCATLRDYLRLATSLWLWRVGSSHQFLPGISGGLRVNGTQTTGAHVGKIMCQVRKPEKFQEGARFHLSQPTLKKVAPSVRLASIPGERDTPSSTCSISSQVYLGAWFLVPCPRTLPYVNPSPSPPLIPTNSSLLFTSSLCTVP